MRKYRNKPQTIDGLRFDSIREAKRYIELKTLLHAGRISELEIHPKLPLAVNGVKIGAYFADFRYVENGKQITEDCKGVKTPVYSLKKKLVRAIHGVEIVEV